MHFCKKNIHIENFIDRLNLSFPVDDIGRMCSACAINSGSLLWFGAIVFKSYMNRNKVHINGTPALTPHFQVDLGTVQR